MKMKKLGGECEVLAGKGISKKTGQPYKVAKVHIVLEDGEEVTITLFEGTNGFVTLYCAAQEDGEEVDG